MRKTLTRNFLTRFVFITLGAWAILLLALPDRALAQGAPATPINLNLSSRVHNLTAGALANSNPIMIRVGRRELDVTPTTPLTPAERLAVYQVFSTNQQSIILGAGGSAVGGSLTLGTNFSQYVSSLVIPKGVTAIRDFGAGPALTLTGDFTDHGTFIAVSSDPSVTSAQISADHVIVTSMANITLLNPIVSLDLTGLSSVLNTGTIQAPSVTINTPLLTNKGSIIASGANGAINVQSTGDLQVAGNGDFYLTGPGAGTITLTANGPHTLNIAGNQTFHPQEHGSISFVASDPDGSVTFAPRSFERIKEGGSLTITTPTLSFLGNNVFVVATGSSAITVNEGGVESPLTVTSPSGGTTRITTAGGTINFDPTDGQNIAFNKSGDSEARLTLTGGNVNIDVMASGLYVDPKVVLTSGNTLALNLDPNQIVGVAFQPYVGANGTAADSFNAYSLQTVTALLQNLKNEGITQIATYGNGYTGYANPPSQAQSSNQYVLQAAKSLGMTVAAGALQWVDSSQPSGWNLTITEDDITSTLAFAKANPGVVTSLVVTNEAIEATTNNEQNAQNVLTLVQFAIAQLANYGFQNTDPSKANFMPVTIREQAGTLTAVNQGMSYSATLKQTLQLVNFAYANIYAYGFNYTLGPTPSQSAFQSYVTSQMTSIYSGIQTAFTAQGITAGVHIGETGWPTAGENMLSPPTPTSPQLAQWSYQAMYNWALANRVQTFAFEAYNEPFKGPANTATPGSDEANFGIFVANGQVPAADYPYNQTNNYALTSVTQQYNLTSLGAGLLINPSTIHNDGTIRAHEIRLPMSLVTVSGTLKGKLVDTSTTTNPTASAEPISYQAAPTTNQAADEYIVSTEDATDE